VQGKPTLAQAEKGSLDVTAVIQGPSFFCFPARSRHNPDV